MRTVLRSVISGDATMTPFIASRKILSAFKNVARPSPIEWVTGRSWRDDDILDALTRGRRVNCSFVEEFQDCLPNFTHKAKMFAIPRYISYVLAHPELEISDYLVGELGRIKDVFFQELTLRQIQALILGLRILEPNIRKYGSRTTHAELCLVQEQLRKLRKRLG